MLLLGDSWIVMGQYMILSYMFESILCLLFLHCRMA